MVDKKEDIVEGIKEEEKGEEEEKKEEEKSEEEKKEPETLLDLLVRLLKEKEASSKPKLLELLE